MPDIKILTEAELRKTVPLDINVIDCIESAFLNLLGAKSLCLLFFQCLSKNIMVK